MRRNRFENFLQMLHFTDNSTLDQTDKYCKIRPLVRIIGDRFGLIFNRNVLFRMMRQ